MQDWRRFSLWFSPLHCKYHRQKHNQMGKACDPGLRSQRWGDYSDFEDGATEWIPNQPRPEQALPQTKTHRTKPEDLRDDSVGKGHVLVRQTWLPELDPQIPPKKLDTKAWICNPALCSRGGMGGRDKIIHLKVSGQLSWSCRLKTETREMLPSNKSEERTNPQKLPSDLCTRRYVCVQIQHSYTVYTKWTH